MNNGNWEYGKKLLEFADLLTRETAERFIRKFRLLDPPKADVHYGKKYARVDLGNSGKYMVDNDGNIFGIKAYGVIHRGHRYGNLDTIHEWDWSEYFPVPKFKGGRS